MCKGNHKTFFEKSNTVCSLNTYTCLLFTLNKILDDLEANLNCSSNKITYLQTILELIYLGFLKNISRQLILVCNTKNYVLTTNNHSPADRFPPTRPTYNLQFSEELIFQLFS